LTEINLSDYSEFYYCQIINKKQLFNFVRTICIRKHIDKNTHKEELVKLETQISRGDNLFNEVFHLERTFENVEALKSILNCIKRLVETAQNAYENTQHLLNPIALLICKNEKTDEDVINCLNGLHKCHSVFISQGKNTIFFDSIKKMFTGKLDNTFNLIDTFSSKTISDNASENEKTKNKLAKQIQFEFQKKKDIIELYKLIFKFHLLVNEKKTIEEAALITETEFDKLCMSLPPDISNRVLLTELFANIDAGSYFSYRHLFLK